MFPSFGCASVIVTHSVHDTAVVWEQLGSEGWRLYASKVVATCNNYIIGMRWVTKYTFNFLSRAYNYMHACWTVIAPSLCLNQLCCFSVVISITDEGYWMVAETSGVHLMLVWVTLIRGQSSINGLEYNYVKTPARLIHVWAVSCGPGLNILMEAMKGPHKNLALA